ncbi:Acetolactate synthase large subunit (EC 2.2.1.6) [uncultured Gammaproteobacteria bacterium]|jgi:acetolactate synthase-1/2/3 large subunit|uniref:biosynthetic-type acetolactate synthase large subunit n=1 Tax=thiotrophic endosymbiont of Bathymodiolus puteoserpentis (Logatchev) TaxID=343240 RepID=UPI0010B9CDC4|nr:biosynthetic-type acetolactate synthase large subunit [thiotrophic endosymbiont of Bathymodiolus puteoserpentis (Logatchev)]CAC9503169.1 Acetolactate synthase large subunit (EC 2.2.1.6) [uncultured Gammaproteobacteria bacterium]CAC9579438.1 Acetolactate synthase large subunit (EC 2.2.1.6) [uncultured Gammaproteobacteria bacterium]CAC9637185.1 Acetolactate synthase large subunit (EC 2.2.1.6) [uncultured Gammaproteobacteria bacterium]CAC9987007.1 Acetolactate synthase large subunit (EC 2.2.1.6
MKLNGAQILVNCLQNEGVEHIFGYPGGAVLHIYDALDACDNIAHILVRHEQGAVHGADGYARVSGKCGVALVTSGPGLTNAVTGIATAHMDSIPMVVISGQVSSAVIGNDAFQEVDAVGITRSCVKHNFLVKDINDLANVVKKAFHIATTGRPGPVLIDITKDTTIAEIEFDGYPKSINMRSYQPEIKVDAGQIDKAVALIMQAKKPIVYSGGGSVIGNASEVLRSFTRNTNFPITQTLMGLGAYPATDAQSLGMLGMHGTYEANMAMHDSDCIIAVGARFDDRITGNLDKFCPYAKIIHIDIDPSSVGKTVAIDVAIIGQVNDALNALIQALKDKKLANIDAWWKQIEEWRSVDSMAYQTKSGVIKPQSVIEALYEVTQGEAIVTSDVGQHQMWAAQYYPFDKPRRWINSGGLGTMGFGLPAAMGAKLADPKADVACVTGEGSIQMMLQELSTMLQYNTPVKIINLNNGYLGMVRQWQEFFYEKRYAMSYMDALPDFVKLAESYGHMGIKVEKEQDLKPALIEAFKQKDRTVFVDILTDPSENVFPMIPSGAGHHEMLLAGRDEMASTNDEGLHLV